MADGPATFFRRKRRCEKLNVHNGCFGRKDYVASCVIQMTIDIRLGHVTRLVWVRFTIVLRLVRRLAFRPQAGRREWCAG